jgi:hypothetical protein
VILCYFDEIEKLVGVNECRNAVEGALRYMVIEMIALDGAEAEISFFSLFAISFLPLWFTGLGFSSAAEMKGSAGIGSNGKKY